MVSALVSGSSGPGSSPGWGHCVVFLGKTRHSHSASLHNKCRGKWVPANSMMGVTSIKCDVMDWQKRGEKTYSWSLHATETGVKRRPDGPLGPNADSTSTST